MLYRATTVFRAARQVTLDKVCLELYHMKTPPPQPKVFLEQLISRFNENRLGQVRLDYLG